MMEGKIIREEEVDAKKEGEGVRVALQPLISRASGERADSVHDAENARETMTKVG